MRSYICYLVLIAAVVAWSPYVRAQQGAENFQPRTVYAVVDYMKVADGRDADYIALEQTVWKKIHQARLKGGVIIGWYLYKVDNEPKNRREYDFVTVNVYDSFVKFEDPFPDEYLMAAYSKEELQKHIRKTIKCRDLIRSEVWKSEAAAMARRRSEKPFIVVHYMQPTLGRETAYRDTELNVFRKMHQARIDAGVMDGWFFLGRRFPGGSEVPYQFVTVNVFPSLEKFQASWTKETLDPVVESLNEEQRAALASMPQLRRMVKQDIWGTVDYVVADDR